MNRARVIIAPMALAATTAFCAFFGPTLGSPGPIVMATLVAASAAASTAGFAFSALAGPPLFHLVEDPVRVVQLLIACSIANQLVMVLDLRHDIRLRPLGIYLAGGICGLPVGVWVLLHLEHRLYLAALGVVLLICGSWALLSQQRPVRLRHPLLDVMAGFLGGVTGGAAAFPSAPITILGQLRGDAKQDQRALFQPYILIMQLAATGLIALVRPVDLHQPGFDPSLLLCLPAGLLGTWLGMAGFRRMSNRQFGMVANALLIVSGVSYVT